MAGAQATGGQNPNEEEAAEVHPTGRRNASEEGEAREAHATGGRNAIEDGAAGEAKDQSRRDHAPAPAPRATR